MTNKTQLSDLNRDNQLRFENIEIPYHQLLTDVIGRTTLVIVTSFLELSTFSKHSCNK